MQTVQTPKYQNRFYYNSTRMILFTYVTTRNAFWKKFPRLFSALLNPIAVTFLKTSFFTTCPDDFPLLDVRDDFCTLPITSKQLF